MKLNKIFIQHFKKIDELRLDLGGRDAEVRGRNGTGKTSIYDAYTWCLFGKSGTGAGVDGQIKQKAKDGTVPADGGVEHIVEIELEKDGGELVALRRSYHEVWAKKRNQPQAGFTGHTTDYWINGVPSQKKDFTDYIGGIGSEEAFKLLSMPLHFCTALHWTERRKILLQICGDITDDDVIASNQKLAALPQLLGGKSVEDMRKILAAKRREINQELEKIPARIDELTRQIPNTADIPPKDALDIEIASLKKQQGDLERQIVRTENGGEVAAKQKAIAEIEAQQVKIKTRMDAVYDSSAGAAERKLKGYRADKATLEKQLDTIRSRASILQRSVAAAEDKMADLRGQFTAMAATEYVSTVEDICPTCGQALPPDKKAAAEEKALEQFNLTRSENLARINAAGKEEKNRVDADKAMQADFDADIAAKTARVQELEAAIEQAAVAAGSAEKPNPLDDTEYAALDDKRHKLLADIKAIREDAENEIRKLKNEITVYDTDIQARQQKVAAIEQSANMKKRIEELKIRETELGKQYTEIEQQIFTTEEFIRAKVALLEGKINEKFEHVRFKLFDTKLNGALDECCEAMIDGVPFGDGLNTGSNMRAGLDIVNVLSGYYGLNIPVFIDNCESYTDLIPVDSQLITLYADADYDDLDIKVK